MFGSTPGNLLKVQARMLTHRDRSAYRYGLALSQVKSSQLNASDLTSTAKSKPASYVDAITDFELFHSPWSYQGKYRLRTVFKFLLLT